MMTGAREKDLITAADMLVDARRTGMPIADLPKEIQPSTLDEAYFIQDKMSWIYEEIGGWKVGAPSPDAIPSFAPMPKAWISCNGCELRGPSHRYRGLEAEIAFCMGSNLPPRDLPYSREEVIAAIASMHPALEILETAFIDPSLATKLSCAADLALHGGFVYGAPVKDWQTIDFSKERVSLTVDGSVRVEQVGSNTAGDLIRLLPWLANEAAARTSGLRAGDWITTGSWTGNTIATAGSAAEARFSTAGAVALRFA